MLKFEGIRGVLTWTPPTQRTDGTALENLVGYRIYFDGGAFSVSVDGAQTAEFDMNAVIDQLGAGPHTAEATSVDADGRESGRTAPVSFRVVEEVVIAPPNPPGDFAVS